MFTPLAPPRAFGVVMQVEFFAMHSALFIGIVALIQPRTPHETLGRKVLFWGLAALYVLGAFSLGLWVGIGFLAVLLGTNVGLLMTWRTPTAGAQLAARWIVAFLFFIVAAGVAGMPKDVAHWDARHATFVFGSLYFLGMGALEAGGLFLRVVPRWAPGLISDANLKGFPDGVRRMFAATGRVADSWMRKIHA